MSTTKTKRHRRPPTLAQAMRCECPQCDGILPDEAIEIGEYRQVERCGLRYKQRTLTMLCPHCGYGERKIQRIPVD